MSSEPHVPKLHCSARNFTVLSLSSSMCACIPAEEISPPPKDLQSLTYALEEALPLDAEDMAVHVGRHLIIAADGRAAREWYSGQENGKQTCIAAVPRAVLIAQGAISLTEPSLRVCVIVVCGNRADILSVCDGKVSAWEWTAYDPKRLMGIAMSWTAEAPELWKIVIVGVSHDAERLNWPEHTQAAVTWIDAPSHECEDLAAFRIVSGLSVPLVSLTSGPLASVDPLAPVRPSMQFLAATAVLSVVLICVALSWRASRYRAEAAELGIQQEAIFRELFPGQNVPVGILSRIESEHRRLAAMKGAGSNIPETGSSLPVMRSFWQALPTDARFNLEFLHFTPSGLKNVDGSAKSYADLESVRLALVAHGFAVPALSSTQNSRGVTLKLDNVLHAPEPPVMTTADKGGKP